MHGVVSAFNYLIVWSKAYRWYREREREREREMYSSFEPV
jgi:hypothetical protein